MTVQLLLNALPGTYAVSRRAPERGVPDWASGPGLVSVTQAPDETSILCLADRVPEGVETSDGWQAVQVSNLVDLDVPGVVLAAVRPVSEAGLGVFVTSTFDRDYLLVRAAQRHAAQAAWIMARHCYVDRGLTLRLAGRQEYEAVAALHFRVWQETYAKIAPPEVRLALNMVRRTTYWRDRLASGAQAVVVEQDGELIGLCALSDCAGEIEHLYVSKAARGAGLGRQLLQLGQAIAHQRGVQQVTLAVVKDNAPAVAFYAACGGDVIAERQDKGPLWLSDNLIYGWPLPA